MIDTLNLINDTIKLELISGFTKNDTLFIKQITSHSENVIKDFMPVITSLIGIIGILIGYLFNKFENRNKQNKEKIKVFKEYVLRFIKADVSFDELLISYYDLPKKIKKQNPIENIRNAKPDDLNKVCHEILIKI